MEENLSHEWMLSNGFHHHQSAGIEIYSKNEVSYVHDTYLRDINTEFELRI